MRAEPGPRAKDSLAVFRQPTAGGRSRRTGRPPTGPAGPCSRVSPGRTPPPRPLHRRCRSPPCAPPRDRSLTQPITATSMSSPDSSRRRSTSRASCLKVHFGPSAGGAGDDPGAARRQLQRAQDLQSYPHLLHRIAGERHPDGVAHALLEQDPQSDGAADGTGPSRAGFGDAQVERVGQETGQTPIGSDRDERRRRLGRDFDATEPESLQQRAGAQRRLHERTGGVSRLQLPEVALQGSTVDAHPYDRIDLSAASTISRTARSPPMLPGFMRIPATPPSSAATASR